MKRIALNVDESLLKRWKNKKTSDGYSGRKFEDHLRYMLRDTPLEDSPNTQIARTTRQTLGKIWMQNFALNLPKMRATDQSLRSIASPDVKKIPAIVIGAGPSVFLNKHLALLAKSDFKGEIIATDKMLIPSLTAGIKVNYVVSVDGDAKLIPPFFDDEIVEEHQQEFKTLLIGTTSPKTVEACEKRGLDIYYFETMQDNPNSEYSSTRSLIYMTMSEQNPQGIQAVPSGGNCGTTALAITIDVLKNYRIALIGFDFGYLKDQEPLKTSYYSSMLASFKERLKEPVPITTARVNSIFSTFHHPDFNADAKSDFVWDSYREALYGILESNQRPIELYNCTMGGTLYNPRLFKCIKLQEFLELTNSTSP